MIATVDRNGDGRISYSEFRSLANKTFEETEISGDALHLQIGCNFGESLKGL